MRLKLALGDETRALEVVDAETVTLAELSGRVAELFEAPGTRPRLAHRDNEGDLVTLSTDAELHRVLEAALRTPDTPLRLLVTIPQLAPPPQVDLLPLMRAMLDDPAINDMVARLVAHVLHTNAPAFSEAIQAAVSVLQQQSQPQPQSQSQPQPQPDASSAAAPSQPASLAATPSASQPIATTATTDADSAFEVVPDSDADDSPQPTAPTTPATAQPSPQQLGSGGNKQHGKGAVPKPLAKVGALLSSLIAPPQQNAAAEAERQRKFDEQVAECEAALHEMGFETRPGTVPQLLRKYKKKELVVEALLQSQSPQHQQARASQQVAIVATPPSTSASQSGSPFPVTMHMKQ